MKNLNFCEILKGHEGETFYNPTFGNMKLNAIYGKFIKFMSIDRSVALTINSNGTFCSSGEVCIFPSKDQCDWNKWIEEHKPKVPKTWSEIKDKNIYYFKVCNDLIELESSATVLSPIEKSALALLKINQLIEVGYGGNIINDEWIDRDITKYFISFDNDNIIGIEKTILSEEFSHIAFHTKEQAEEFLSYPENIELLKDYFMI